MQTALRILRYLKGEPSIGVLLSSTPTFDLLVYCDADWASCPHSRKSVSGFIVFFGNTLATWKSKKQATVSLSSVKAEYKSIRRLVAELSWLSHLLRELTIPSITPIPVKCDNLIAIYIAKKPAFHECTKRIALNCRFVRHKLMEGLIRLNYVPPKHQLADVLTKPLTGVQHIIPFCSNWGFTHPPICRGC